MIPTGQAQRGAYASGYDARLGGASRWANPYNARLDEHARDGDRPGWLGSFAVAWLDGWHAADNAVGEPVPAPPRPRRSRRTTPA